MKAGTEDRKKLIAAGSFGVLAVGYLLYTLLGSSGSPDVSASPPVTIVTTARPAPPSSQPAASVNRQAFSRLDPTLHPEGMLLTESLVYFGSGRNIFLPPGAASAQAVVIPRPLASARYVPPSAIASTTAPSLPPIDLRFFGTSTSRDGKRQAFLLRGDDVFIASQGDVVSRRYRVGSISASAVEVTDLSSNNTQRLPMSSQ